MNKQLTYWILLFVITVSNAQRSSFVHYSTESGLSHSNVQCLEQLNDGSLLVGTIAGVTKFNGTNAFIYSKDDGLAEDWVTCSHTDSTGTVWLGHLAGGVSRYHQETNTFENIDIEQYTRFRKINAISHDQLNRIWIATEGAGIIVLDGDSGKLFSLDVNDGLSTNTYYGICKDNKNNMWLASDSGVVIYDGNVNSKSQSSFTVIDKAKGLPSNHVTAISLIKDLTVWVGTADSGVIVFNVPDKLSLKTAEQRSFKPFSINTSHGLRSNFIQQISSDNEGNIWLATAGGGASKIIPFESELLVEAIQNAVVKTYSTANGLDYFTANSICPDKEGNVWIGTSLGLNQYKGETFLTYTISDSLPSNLVWSCTVDKSSNVWVGTNKGVAKIVYDTKASIDKTKMKLVSLEKIGLSNTPILTIHEDNFGNIWFGTDRYGIYYLPPGQNIARPFSSLPININESIYSIVSDKKGNIWFGVKEGAVCYNPITKTSKKYTMKDGLGGSNIFRIYNDSKGRLWFGALGGKLSYFDSNQFKTFDEKDGLKQNFILSIAEDRNGDLWFGTYGGHLYQYTNEQFLFIEKSGSEIFKTPYSLVFDNESKLWIGTEKGLVRYEPEKGVFSSYGNTEGFPEAECNANAVCKDPYGNIWLGTTMGVVRLNPAEDRPNKIEPGLSLTDLKVYFREKEFPLDNAFEHDQNHLTFTFNAISLSNPNKITYNYKLDGFDKEWLPQPTSNNEVTYSNLSPGKYTLLVKAYNAHGLGSSTPLSYQFKIKPPFSQTATFYVIMSLFIIFCLYGADKVRRKNLRNEKERLSQRVKELEEENKKLKEES